LIAPAHRSIAAADDSNAAFESPPFAAFIACTETAFEALECFSSIDEWVRSCHFRSIDAQVSNHRSATEFDDEEADEEVD